MLYLSMFLNNTMEIFGVFLEKFGFHCITSHITVLSFKCAFNYESTMECI